MIDTDKYEGHTPGPWIDVGVELIAGSKCPVCYGDYFKTGENENDNVCEIQRYRPDFGMGYVDPIAVVLPKGGIPHPEFPAETVEQLPNMKLIADAPLLFEEVKRLDALIREIESLIPENPDYVCEQILGACHRYMHTEFIDVLDIGKEERWFGYTEKCKEIERLRKELSQNRECLRWCYDLKRFGKEIKDEHWDFIGRLLGADTDHNDNPYTDIVTKEEFAAKHTRCVTYNTILNWRNRANSYTPDIKLEEEE